MNNYFRASSFLYFYTCELIFNEKEADPIDFGGGHDNHVLDPILVDAEYLSDDTSTDESYNDEQFAYDNFMANQFPNENPLIRTRLRLGRTLLTNLMMLFSGMMLFPMKMMGSRRRVLCWGPTLNQISPKFEYLCVLCC
ncbi:hypothetical protein ABFX02_12G061400 [Erythranthe guttata]